MSERPQVSVPCPTSQDLARLTLGERCEPMAATMLAAHANDEPNGASAWLPGLESARLPRVKILSLDPWAHGTAA